MNSYLPNSRSALRRDINMNASCLKNAVLLPCT